MNRALKEIRKEVLLGCLLFFVLNAAATEKYSISGTITDAENGETMIGATVTVKEIPGSGTISNAYGYYSLTLKHGEYTLEVSFIGYEKSVRKMNLTKNTRMNFKLEPASALLEEVVIVAEQRNENIVSDKIGVEKIAIEDVKKIPVLFGEQDVIKTLTLTPGVKTTGEGSGGMFVRGGNNSQNLVLLDEATVYNSNHLMGFFSTFNSDAIKDLTLYKGTAPAEYGGRISSVMDIKMNDGNNQDFHIGGGIGLISSKLNVEGPIVKDKGSFLVTGRRTYADLFLKLSSDEQLNNNQLYFYDLNAKANYRLNENNRIYLSGYFGRDVVEFQDRFGVDWGNITGTLRWNHIWNNKLFSNTSLIYSDYDYKVAVTRESDDFSLTSVINNWNLKQDFQYFLNNRNTMSFGFSSQYHTITPGQVEVSEDSDMNPVELQDRYALENALYFSNKWEPGDRWKINYGLRLTSFTLLGPGDFYSYGDAGVTDSLSYEKGEVVQSYLHLEPRLNLAYILNESASLKASYTRNTQNLHLIQNSNSSTPTDLWIASSQNVKPEISDQVALGYFKNFKNDQYQFSGEVYYRWMQNQLDLKNGAEIRANEHIEGELLSGSGRAYGLEMMLKKKYGKLNGWISYTLSRTERKIDGINNSNWYPARQDATHDLSIVGIYDLTPKWSLSATWVYNTGNAVTFPSGKYEINGNVEYYYTERNGYRMPAYHRLDLGATRTLKKRERFESSLSFSLYNTYGRKNAYTIDFEEDLNDPMKTVAVKTYLFTYVPSISYIFKF
ncbi:MAG: TonB-dependent receptor [Bacteroidota bacterium]